MNRKKAVEQIDQVFDYINADPKKVNVEELIYAIEAVVPVHVSLEIKNYDEVDDLLAVYPYIYQKLIKLFAFYIHQVRSASTDKTYTGLMRSYRDCVEELMKATKLQYDALSRRITNEIERRG